MLLLLLAVPILTQILQVLPQSYGFYLAVYICIKTSLDSIFSFKITALSACKVKDIS